MTPALERTKRGEKDVVHGSVGRGDAAGGEGTGVELVIRAENQCGVEVIGARRSPASGEASGEGSRPRGAGCVEELPDRSSGGAQGCRAGLRDRHG
jgi:hypothetical protein